MPRRRRSPTFAAIVLKREADCLGFHIFELAHFAMLPSNRRTLDRALRRAEFPFPRRIGARARAGRHAHVESRDMIGDLRKLGDVSSSPSLGQPRGTRVSNWARCRASHMSRAETAPRRRRTNVAAFLGGEAREKRRARSGISSRRERTRNADRKDVEPVKQILAKLPALDLLDQILIGRRDQPHIDAHRPLRADRVDLALLCARSSLTCKSSGNSPISSRNSVPPLARGISDVLFGGAGEGSFSWPNRIDSTRLAGSAPQLTVMKACRGDPRRLECARDDLLADARFALDQHGMVECAERSPSLITRAISGCARRDP